MPRSCISRIAPGRGCDRTAAGPFGPSNEASAGSTRSRAGAGAAGRAADAAGTTPTRPIHRSTAPRREPPARRLLRKYLAPHARAPPKRRRAVSIARSRPRCPTAPSPSPRSGRSRRTRAGRCSTTRSPRRSRVPTPSHASELETATKAASPYARASSTMQCWTRSREEAHHRHITPATGRWCSSARGWTRARGDSHRGQHPENKIDAAPSSRWTSRRCRRTSHGSWRASSVTTSRSPSRVRTSRFTRTWRVRAGRGSWRTRATTRIDPLYGSWKVCSTTSRRTSWIACCVSAVRAARVARGSWRPR